MFSGPPNPVFDTLYAAGAAAVSAGTHRRDEIPVDGGRWPVSVVATTNTVEFGERLASALEEVLPLIGAGHFLTGLRGAAHITVRALEAYRDAACRDESITGEWMAAMDRTAAATTPFTMAFTGYTLTASGVLAQLEAIDAQPWEFMDRFEAELGELAWYEKQFGKRNIWYASIVHFANDIANPDGLIDWVANHRTLDPTMVRITGLELLRFHHAHLDDSRQLMRPTCWHTSEFVG